MSNTVAVLLIIGSAVVGPIEAKPTSVDEDCVVKSAPQMPSPVQCNVLPSDVGRCLERAALADNAYRRRVCGKMETVSELCERAMREIGAGPNENKHAVEPYKSMWSLGRTIAGGPMGVMMGVYCIPVPEGYRK